jgi:hypothetical protein
MSNTTSSLHDSEFLRAFLNLIIPARADLPAAGDLGLGPEIVAAASAGGDAEALGAGLDEVQRAAAAHGAGGLAALDPAAARAVIETVSASRPMFMFTVCRYLYLAYYQDPRVLVALGEPARPPFPDGFELEPMSPDLLALLESRKIR